MKKLFDTEKSPACQYCKYGRFTPDSTGVLCTKKGIMLPDSYCKSYKYDVLKRRPKKRPQLMPGYTEDDFKL